MNTKARESANHLSELLRKEHAAMAEFLVALAEFDRTRLWEPLGHKSLFAFLRRDLGLSAGAAQYRKTAAELVRRYPEVEAALRDGRLCLSSVIELAKVITPENAAEVLPRFYGLSSRDAALVAVSIRPVENPPAREVVTPVRTVAPAAVPVQRADPAPPKLAAPEPAADAGAPAFRAPETTGSTLASRADPLPRPPAPLKLVPPAAPEVEPLDATHVRLHVTVSREFMAKLQATKDALSHALPGATTEAALVAAMDLVLDRYAKRKGS